MIPESGYDSAFFGSGCPVKYLHKNQYVNVLWKLAEAEGWLKPEEDRYFGSDDI
jgi:hypothetical protein